jgi:orotidine-5'-phosphate decarboxylase
MFAENLAKRVEALHTPVLMGLDPRADLIPDDCFVEGRSDAVSIAKGFERFGIRLLEALADKVAAVKPQIAFYEALGLPGLQAYIAIIKRARELGIPTIADIKRGDIGSTAEAYACAHLKGSQGEDAPFEADAVTLNAWLGEDSLTPFFERCQKYEKGVYLLLHTSNPGSTDLQEWEGKGAKKVYQHLADLMDRWQDQFTPTEKWSSIGAVVGATWPSQLVELRDRLPRTPFLVPGYGSQGGKGEDVAFLFEKTEVPHLINASRSLTYAYRNEEGMTLEEGALKACEAMRKDILESAQG